MTKASTKAAKGTPPAPTLRDPTAAEAEAIAAARASIAARPSRVEVRQTPRDGKVMGIGQPHSDGRGWSDQLTDTFGTASQAWCEAALLRLCHVAQSWGAPSATDSQTNAVLAMMGAIAPADELEGAIGEQIIA